VNRNRHFLNAAIVDNLTLPVRVHGEIWRGNRRVVNASALCDAIQCGDGGEQNEHGVFNSTHQVGFVGDWHF
jgi:hypothetical protein